MLEKLRMKDRYNKVTISITGVDNKGIEYSRDVLIKYHSNNAYYYISKLCEEHNTKLRISEREYNLLFTLLVDIYGLEDIYGLDDID